jgi:asparagine synthase (glutamine-hydrolysing)
MCGIAGYLGTGDRGFLENAIRVIGHRGPDGHDLWADKQIGLAHVRLAIQDLSENGRQPMVSACGRYIITYNGEVYNGEDLKKNYLKAGSSLRGHSDTEILLECWAKHGHRYLKDLNGIFAFAIWDRVEESLFLVRDGLGVKPLYLSEHSEGIVFSSELKAVLLHPKVDRSLDPIAVGDYLT